MKKRIIAPSILSCDFSKLGEELAAIEKAGADWVHVDVMDGHFVPNLTIGPPVVSAVKANTKLPLDVHLMISNPDQYLEAYAKAGAAYLTVHQETCSDLKKTISKIKSLNVKAAVTLNPATSIETLKDFVAHVDMVLVMTVNPGFSGQKFISECVDKIKTLSTWRKEQSLKFLIEVDGGINEQTIQVAANAGADVFVAGNAVFKSPDYTQAIQLLRK